MADDSEEHGGDATEYFPSPKQMVKTACDYITRSFQAGDENDGGKWDKSDTYNFKHSRRGIALIVCNENFQKHGNRVGAELDVKNFQNTFQKLGFHVSDIRVRYNMTIEEMMLWFEAVSREDHSDQDAFICAITSHGDELVYVDPARYNIQKREDVILGTDDNAVLTRHLVEIFRDEYCPSLAGKPKVFLLQACRGTKLDDGLTIQADMDFVDAATDLQYTVSPPPCYKDFLIVYATPPGHFAFRRPSEGSWFVKALWEVAANTDTSKVSFTKLITRVFNQVAKSYESASTDVRIHAKKQMGCMYSMLTKDLYFLSRSESEEEPMM